MEMLFICYLGINYLNVDRENSSPESLSSFAEEQWAKRRAHSGFNPVWL